MGSAEEQYKEIFLAEAFDNLEQLNKLFTVLEKDHQNNKAIEIIFRITHTMKGNALGLGFDDIASLAHTMEDVFSEIRDNKIDLNESLFNDLYRAADALGSLINFLKSPTDKPVRYKGIKTKLEVFLKNARGGETQPQETQPQVNSTAHNVQENNQETQTTEFVNTPSKEPIEETPEELLEEEEKSEITFSDLVQVPVRKLDALLDLVGELMIEKDRILAEKLAFTSDRGNELSMLQRITADLQYSVMDVRLVQTGFLFHKFHRIVRDAAKQENKRVNLILEGTNQEIDRNILQAISDSLIHLVRNAVGHGIEAPEKRKLAGKPEEGTINLSASAEKDNVIIRISDDGAGIDPIKIKKKAIEKGFINAQQAGLMADSEAIMLIFEAGFSSADSITSISGRGVGMDVVKRSIDKIGGKVNVQSRLGLGTTITLSLPSSMAVKSALLFEVSGEPMALPLTYTESVINIAVSNIKVVPNGLITKYLDQTISLIFLSELFGKATQSENKEAINLPELFKQRFKSYSKSAFLNIVVVSYNGKVVGLVVDKLMQQKEIVEKPLFKPLDNLNYLSGVTILGNGSVCLVLDVSGITEAVLKANRIKTFQ
ncbi:MAG: chemotaxis protein CheA [Luteibaculaceae bacterium]